MPQNLFFTRKDRRHKISKLIVIAAIIFAIAAAIATILIPKIPEISLTDLNAIPVTSAPCQLSDRIQPPAHTKPLNFDIPTNAKAKIFRRIKPKSDRKVIALTIDDGPWPETTAAMLNIFQQNS